MNQKFSKIVWLGFLLFFVAAPLFVVQGNALAVNLVSLQSKHKFSPEQGSGDTDADEERFEVVNLADAGKFKKKPDYASSDATDSGSFNKRLTCRSAYIMDARTGKTIFAQRADLPGQPASTIKVVTGLIAIESLNDKDMVYASRYAVNMPRSKMYMRQGASYRATDLINAVLLASANDASVALAEKVAGSEQAFARLMTKKAESLGAKNTVCKSANGLTRDGQQSTPRDLAKIFNRAMQNQEFANRMSLTTVKTKDGKVLRTHNKALWTVDGAVGGKTGYTYVARKTYVGKFERGDQSLIVALMGSESMWQDIATLVEFGFKEHRKIAAAESSADHSNGESGDSVRISLSSHNDTAHEASGIAVLTEQKKKTKL